MTDELSDTYGPGSYITEFVSGGPKTYAYLVQSTTKNTVEEVCKVKGLTLNMTSAKKVNFEQLRMMVQKEGDTSVTIINDRIRRTGDRDLLTVVEPKIFKITGAKRRAIQDSYDTLPYGFKRPV